MSTKQDLSGDLAAINQISIVPQLLDVICRTTKLRFAAISRVTDDRWLACATIDKIPIGLNTGDELDANDTFCNLVYKTGNPVIFDDVKKDERYRDHHVTKLFGIESYISVPIYRRNGDFFGTLCALDLVPARVNTPEVIDMLKLYADLIAFHLETVDTMEATSKNLKEEQEMGDLREKSIAILGHDLKNPIATMRMSSDILLKMSKEELTLKHAAMIKSTSFRMQNLIENMLDFAKGKLGEGIDLNKASNNGSLIKILKQVIKELNISSPEREINFEIDLKSEVYCDKNRIGQLLANLLSNADLHGDRVAPLKVVAQTTADTFELNVINKGEMIPKESLSQLFQPFYRNTTDLNKKGLGLGLFIAAEIAKAHKGKLMVESSTTETRFTLSIPLKEI